MSLSFDRESAPSDQPMTSLSLMNDDTDEDTMFTLAAHPVDSFAHFEEIRADGKLCDVAIRCGTSVYRAHKVVLAATVPYFRAMFTSNMLETNLAEIVMGDAEGIDADTMDALISFAYNGRVHITTNNVQSLMMGAAFLSLDCIVDACAAFLQKRLQACNVLTMRSFAISVNSSTLIKESDRFIHKHFVAISGQSDEFLALSVEELIDVLGRDQLHIANEEQAKDYHLLPDRRGKLNTFTTKARSCDDIAGILYAVGGLTTAGDSQSTVEMYNPVTGQWSVIEPMSTLRSRVGVTVKDGLLYAIGGFNGYERLKTVEVFDTVKRKWHEVAPLRNKRSALGSCVVDSRVYDGITSLATVEAYDSHKDMWTMQKPMQKQRSAAGIATIDGIIYVIGGHDGTSIFPSVERFDTVANRWSVVTPMNSRRCRLGAAMLNGKIYACGGYDGAQFLSTVECFDPSTGQWTYLASMNVKRSRVSLVANCGRLYAIGGYDGNTNLSSMEVYDQEKNEWTYATPMSAHEGGVGIGVVPATNVLDFD